MSYKKEVIANDMNYNIITVLMAAHKTDLEGALNELSSTHDMLADNFLRTREDVLRHRNGLQSWGKEIDDHVALYIDGLGEVVEIRSRHSNADFCPGRWVRGSDDWSFASQRWKPEAPCLSEIIDMRVSGILGMTALLSRSLASSIFPDLVREVIVVVYSGYW